MRFFAAQHRQQFLAKEPAFDSTSPKAAGSLAGAGANGVSFCVLILSPGGRWPYCQRPFQYVHFCAFREILF
jgi:hypothetical protein